MKKNYYFIFSFLLVFFGLNGFGQSKIFLGIDAGVAIFKTKVDNLEGDNFKEQTRATHAPTGLNINIETGRRWCVEFGVYLQSFDDNSFSHENAALGSGASSSGSLRAAASFNFKIKRLILMGNKFTLAPYIGITKISMDGPAGYLSPYSKIGSGSSSINGVVTKDSTFSQHYYESNSITAPIIGLDVSYELVPRLNVCAGFSYLYSPQYNSFQFVEYFRDGQSVRSAIISYGGSGFYLQLGLKWNWRDIVKPGSYSLVEIKG